ncbi:hypothetical protein BATMR_11870 [Bacillus altitudinis]|nr:hypothetical protein BATMR_11870 [Bacillus altitudinis]
MACFISWCSPYILANGCVVIERFLSFGSNWFYYNTQLEQMYRKTKKFMKFISDPGSIGLFFEYSCYNDKLNKVKEKGSCT